MSDLIERQAAIDAFGLSEKTRKYGGDHSGYDTRMLYEIQDILEELPSTQLNACENTCEIARKPNDMISRQSAIDALKEHRALYCDNTPDTFSKLSYAEKSRVDELDTAIATLVNLQSTQPERTGHWTKISPALIYECSECGQHVLTADIDAYKFCHGCGAKMLKEGETHD